MNKTPLQRLADIIDRTVDPSIQTKFKQAIQQSIVQTNYLYESPVGFIAIVQTHQHITRISFCNDSVFSEPPLTPETDLLRQVGDILDQYFAGESVDFGEIPIEIEVGTDFQKSVWDTIHNIPHGEVRSYKWIAEKIGRPKAVRAVGNATGSNPITIIIPCHRVVGSNGNLGGYGGGLERKQKLLTLEGYPVESLQKPRKGS